MVDYEVNDKAADRLISGETLYPGPSADGHYEFKYPPFAAIFYIPTSLLPLGAAKSAWALIVLAASAAVIGLSLKLAGHGPGIPRLLSLLPALVLARFFLRELQLGQVNTLVALLMLVMTSLLAERGAGRAPSTNEKLAGLTWGLASAIKLYPLIFFPYFALKKKWKALAAGLAVFSAAFMLPAAFFGWQGNLRVHGEWLSTLSRSTPGLFSSQDNLSLPAAAFKITGNPASAAIFWVLGSAALGAAVLLIMSGGRSVRRPEILECAALMLAVPLISPLGWDYTFLLSVLGLSLCFRFFGGMPRAWRIVLAADSALVALTLFDVLGRRLYAQFMSLSLMSLFFIVVFILLAGLRRRALA
jgi:alpha-1,2-mannosyltransferase